MKKLHKVDVEVVIQFALDGEGVDVSTRQKQAKLIAEKLVELYEGYELANADN